MCSCGDIYMVVVNKVNPRCGLRVKCLRNRHKNSTSKKNHLGTERLSGTMYTPINRHRFF